MHKMKSMSFCLSLFLTASLANAHADTGNGPELADPVQDCGVFDEDNGNPGGDPPKSVVKASVPLGYTPLTGHERWNHYVRNAFWSPGVFFRAAGPAAGQQMNNEPPQWGQGMEGYSKRFANRFGRFALQQTYEGAGAALLKHEVRYIRSNKTGFLPRAAHALTANIITYDRNGHRVPHVSRVGAMFAAEFTGNLWMPDGYRDTSKAVRGVGMELGVRSAFNLIKEFAPELKRMAGKK